MLTRGIDAVSWQAYTLRLYGEGGPLADAVPQPVEVDLVYDAILSPALRPHHLHNEHCPHRPNKPYALRSPHSPLVSWFRRQTSTAHKPAPSHTWLEVSHCGGSAFEAHGAWMYATRGSALFINIGRTRVFQTHAEAVRRLLKSATAGCAADADMCSAEFYQVEKSPAISAYTRVIGACEKATCTGMNAHKALR